MGPRSAFSRGERRRVAYLLRRICGIFNDPDAEWRVAFLRVWGEERACRKHGVQLSTTGFVDDDRSLIVIDPRHEVISTFVHECFHVLYEDEDEDRIVELERFVIERITPRQAAAIVRLMAQYLA